jgi:hypothetical protein
LYTNQLAGKDDTTRILVFKVKSRGTLPPGKQKLPKPVDEGSPHLSEELAGKPLAIEDSRAAIPFIALPC